MQMENSTSVVMPLYCHIKKYMDKRVETEEGEGLNGTSTSTTSSSR